MHYLATTKIGGVREMNIKFDFSGKIALITGAASGIGRRTAIRFAEAGASVVIVDFNEADGKKTADDCKALGVTSAFYKADVADERDVAEMGRKVLAEFGHIDYLISNAGIFGTEKGNPITNISAAEFRKMFDINTVGFLNMIHAFYENFTSRRQGKIVATSSVAAFKATVKVPQYAATKASVNIFVRSLAAELGAFNINVNSIAPGYVYTPLYHDALKLKELQPENFKDCETSEDVMNKMARKSALRRAQTEDDMANAFMILCADETENVTGQCLVVDAGGLLMY
jgi:3-oxoacyl-[acyl-carrier protein] reductase